MDDVQKINTPELRYRRLFKAAQDGILILDVQTGAITAVNPILIKMLGYSREGFIQRKLWEVGAVRDIEASREAFKALQMDEYIRYEDLPLRAKNGKPVDVEYVNNVYLVGDERVIQCNIGDITERKQAEDALLISQALLQEKSVRDHLTGLFNDTWGHAAGDGILREWGNLLSRYIRGVDIPCRYGGDEFILILPDASREVTRARAELISEYARHFHLQYESQILMPVTL